MVRSDMRLSEWRVCGGFVAQEYQQRGQIWFSVFRAGLCESLVDFSSGARDGPGTGQNRTEPNRARARRRARAQVEAEAEAE